MTTMKPLMKTVMLGFLAFYSLCALADYKPNGTYVKYKSLLHVHHDGSDEQWLEVQIRVNTQAGVSGLGEQSISFNSTLSSLEVLEAYTLKANGEKVTVEPDKIRTQDDVDDGGGSIYSDSKVKLIIYPNLEIGAQIFYKVHLVRHTPVFPGQFYWTRLASPYYRYEDMQVDLIQDAGIELLLDTPGFTGGKVDSAKDDPLGSVRYQHRFVQNEAYPSETATVSAWDFAPHYTVSSFKNYRDVGLAYQTRAAPMAQVTPEIEAKAIEITQNAQSETDKVRALYNWVSRSIRYIGIYAGAGGYVPHEAASVLKNQYGDCKDHVVLLEAMLKVIGVESTPALINASSAFRLPTLATPSIFDHVITYIPKMNLFLDSTAQYAPMGTLPEMDLNKPVILTATGDTARTRQSSPDLDSVTSNINLVLMPDGTVVGKTVSWMRGYEEIDSRMSRAAEDNKDQQRLINRLLNRFFETGTGELMYEDPGLLDLPWKTSATFILDPVVNLPGQGGLILPTGVSPGEIRGMSIYTPPKVRRFPVICGSAKYIELYEMTFPKKMEVIHIPKDVHYKGETLQYEARYVFKNHLLSAKRQLIADRKGRICDAKDDAEWNAMATVMKRDLRQQVLFN